MIRLERLSKHFLQGQGEVRALDGVDLEVQKGEFLSVMGPSGSGKSTLLHLIAGLETPTSGEIYIQDRALSRMSDDEITVFRRRHIGFVFQFFNLLPALTAEENVALPLLLDGKRMTDVRSRADDMLDLVGLAARREHRAQDLSGGEMQRVAIARALVTDPLLMLADEPTGALDSRTGEEILKLFSGLARERGHTVVLVTHDAYAAGFGDSLITFKDGRVVDRARSDGLTSIGRKTGRGAAT